MKKTITLIIAAFGLTAAHAQGTCTTAIPITPGTYPNEYVNGGDHPPVMCMISGGNPITGTSWYTYTPTALYTSIVATYVEGYPELDTRVNIYKGDCGGLSCVTGDDDSGPGFSSMASFTAEPGVTYYIVFDNNWNPEPFHFSLTETVWTPPMFTQQTVNITGNTIWCVADLNGDYLDDIVSPDLNQVTVLYQAENDSGFRAATLPAAANNNAPSWSMAAGDFDNNGFNDLLYGANSGATLLLANNDGTAFTSAIDTPEYVFSQRTNFIDINNDGNLDAFICHDVQPNVYFFSDGNGGATFHRGGLGDVATGGNYGSIWVDYDNDGDMDLFIAKCRGGEDIAASVDELHRNNGDGTFTNVAVEAGFADHHQSWSAAWADYDNDGDMDVMIGASSTSGGGHKLMRNNGDGTFTNITPGSGFEFTGLNIEHIAHDFNNDGWVDVFGVGTRIMMNNGDFTFTPKEIPVENGPIGDLNNDGFLDIVNGNRVFFNYDNGNHWLKVHLQGEESNRNGIGARIEIYASGDGWTKQIRDVRSGDGFKFMSSLNTHFGLGATDAIEQLVIKWPSGTVDIIENPDVDNAILVVEGSTVLGTNNPAKNVFSLYPNPAKDVINIKADKSFNPVSAAIYSLEGKLLLNEKVTDSKVKVSHLAKGTYIIILKGSSGKQYSKKFIKG